jgi:hypothetical protein
MAREDDDDDSLPPLGENTDKFLDQAKKGQPRNFLLVCKGNKVNYLAVRKKPIKKNELNEAKKSGYKGEGYFGVITGKGMELVFNLSSADGYTSEPVKDKILKDFLEEKADFKCKPTIAIVATLPAVPFDDEDLKNPLVARFLALDVKISEVLDLNPDAEAELGKTTTEIRLLLQEANFDSAEPRIAELETRLQELLSGAAASPSASSATGAPATSTTGTPATSTPNTQDTAAPSPTVDQDALKAKLQAALDKLVPQLKQAVATYPDRKVELLTPVAQIKKQMDSGDLENARVGILSVGQLLKSLPQSVSEVSIMKLGKARVEWLTTRDKAIGDLKRLKAMIAEEFGDDTEQAEVLADAMHKFDQLISTVDNALHEQLDLVLNAEVNERGPLVKSAKATISALVNTLNNDEVMQEIDGNEFDPATNVVEPLNKKLQEISVALG